MTLSLTRAPRRLLALTALATALVCGGAILFAAADAAATTACRTAISGTYFRSADFLLNLERDGTLAGNYSQTTQDAIGLNESFDGHWSCSGQNVSLTHFHFLVNGSDRLVERGGAIGTFDGHRNLTLTYTFHVFPETASAADLRAGMGTVVNIPTFVATRVLKF